MTGNGHRLVVTCQAQCVRAGLLLSWTSWAIRWEDHMVRGRPLTPPANFVALSLHFFSFFLFFVPLVGGIYPKQTSTDGYLEIKCWLFSSDSRRWWINTVSSIGEATHCMLSLEDIHQRGLMDSINKGPLVLPSTVEHVQLHRFQ